MYETHNTNEFIRNLQNMQILEIMQALINDSANSKSKSKPLIASKKLCKLMLIANELLIAAMFRIANSIANATMLVLSMSIVVIAIS